MSGAIGELSVHVTRSHIYCTPGSTASTSSRVVSPTCPPTPRSVVRLDVLLSSVVRSVERSDCGVVLTTYTAGALSASAVVFTGGLAYCGVRSAPTPTSRRDTRSDADVHDEFLSGTIESL